MMWSNVKLTKEFIFDIHFVTLNDLDHVTSKYFFLWHRVTPGTPLIFDFQASKYFLMNCLAKEKIIKNAFFL